MVCFSAGGGVPPQVQHQVTFTALRHRNRLTATHIRIQPRHVWGEISIFQELDQPEPEHTDQVQHAISSLIPYVLSSTNEKYGVFFIAARPNLTHGFPAYNSLFEVRRFNMAPKLPGTARLSSHVHFLIPSIPQAFHPKSFHLLTEQRGEQG
jgi:hypothetical protein